MRVVTLDHPADFDGWRTAARALAAADVPAHEVTWQVAGDTGDLLATAAEPPPAAPARFSVPRTFVDLAESVVCHSDPARFGLLYRALLRLRETPRLLEDKADPLVDRLEALRRSVARDIHKMRAFVRFREVTEEDGARFVAWFEPDHHIVRRNAGFFVRRFSTMRWSILTPEVCALWDGETLDFTPGATKTDAPDGDAVEATWRTYYASTFNPARLKVKAMLKEMPKKYWRNMPETALVPALIAAAGTRTEAMIEAGAPAPHAQSLAELAAAAKACTRCPLHGPATQTVFGEGPADAPLMFVGEQPGDQEDLAGRPFVGPAGQMFDKALAAAGVARATAYITNAVKHFKFEPRGKRRIHQTPQTPEIKACGVWLAAERAQLRPKLIVALGATAARAVLGRAVTIGKTRGQPVPLDDGSELWVTIHPSYLLRIEDPEAARAEYDRFVADLAQIRERLGALA
ncbi:MAG: UdgX family uracil-DNA binding protein [Alphaproteobacteria bacterium]|nr:UdgX family uracil-DNA binding protein [Alphaproteobacteria bacterium]